MKKIVILSTIAFLSTSIYADSNMQAKLDAMMAKIEQMEKAQQAKIDVLTKKIETLEGEKKQVNASSSLVPVISTSAQDKKIATIEKKLAKVEKKQAKHSKKISKVNALAAKDNLKFDVDFRTTYDNIQYKTNMGKRVSNDGLYSNRLWLGMGYKPTDTIMFKGSLGYQKAFGATDTLQAGGRGVPGGFDTFDWVVNENMTDDSIRLREAYWLWTPTLGDFPLTVSVGRRPSTNGYLINLRDDDQAKSPMGHLINMEFDGASAGIKLNKFVPGMAVKLCLGRGLTNANSRMDESGMAYAENGDNLDNVDMVGLIFKPYDNGQYSVMTKWYRGFDVPGMYATKIDGTTGQPTMYEMKNGGDMDGAAVSFKVEGIGDEISDFLDETIFFASYAWSQSNPGTGVARRITDPSGNVMMTMVDQSMMGSTDKQSGTSYWVGLQTPNLTGGKFGIEYNHGSKYWRPFTYGEDTAIGSKMATRGDAYEAYWTQPIIGDIFTFQLRYTYIDYEYTGSNGFFGDGGTPMTMGDAKLAGYEAVDKAQDIRMYLRYRY